MKGDEMEELQMITRMDDNVKWFNSHYGEIREHENMFVAIIDSKIIAESESIEGLIKGIEKQGEDPGLALIKFIPKKGTVLIL